MDEPGSLQTYLLYYWAVSLYESTLILAELDARHQLPALHSVLDIGSGPGPASFAANVFGAEKALLVDKSEKALAIARNIAAEGRKNVDTHVFSKANFEIITQCMELEEFRVPQGEAFDLIVASHSLNELWQGTPDWLERRRDFLLRLLPALRPGGVLLIIEPSAHYTSIPLLALRDALLSSTQSHTQAKENALGCVGPCPHSECCPMLAYEGRPCFSELDLGCPTAGRRTGTLRRPRPFTAQGRMGGVQKGSARGTAHHAAHLGKPGHYPRQDRLRAHAQQGGAHPVHCLYRGRSAQDDFGVSGRCGCPLARFFPARPRGPNRGRWAGEARRTSSGPCARNAPCAL